MQKLSFTPWHGTPYQRFNIMVQQPDRTRRIGRILAPNEELALIKARERFPDRDVFIEKRKPKQKKEEQSTETKPS